uniref:Homocysteine-responsive endoplasmic reticulum-resident ubiquitin-like domain member 2 protein n=1 Tax=Anopheles maculatus TaxID=74869 RepID=A0A182SL48_9DIPT
MQYFNQYINLINGQNNANALYSASGLPGAAGTAETATPTTINPLSGSQPFPAVPFVPMVQPSAMAGGFPNLAYYPCMTAAPYSSGFPSATNIPSAPSGSVNVGNVPGGVLSSSATLPSSASGQAIPSPQTSTSIVAGDASTAQSASGGTETATAVAAAEQAAGAPQDGAQAGAAVAGPPAQARRFPNIVVEEQENNDWLDVFFSMCRVGILITVIYLYSSPMRCLTVLFIGVMLYLKKHLDRVYQAIDRRIPRLQPNQDANAAAAAPREQPPVGPVQPNNNVPDHNPAEPQGPHAANVGASGVENVSKTTRSSETENAAGAGPSGSSSNDASSTSSRTIGRTNEPTIANAGVDEQQQTERTNTSEGETATAEQPAAEGQRMTFNDMTSFLGTLVITFFTSIIPDTPAA